MNIKKMVIGASASAVLFGTLATVAFASPNTLNWGSEVNAGECEKIGAPVVNVTQKILNSVDSGEDGNNWALDNYNRRIQVFATNTEGEYCAVLNYAGQFDAQEGQLTPGIEVPDEFLDGDEDGTFEGGYRATITGTLLDEPLWKTRGSVGTTDYECDIDGNCPGAVNWVEQYFEPLGPGDFVYEWWGWIYHAGNNGSWVNSSVGNSGDIL